MKYKTRCEMIILVECETLWEQWAVMVVCYVLVTFKLESSKDVLSQWCPKIKLSKYFLQRIIIATKYLRSE